MTVNFQDSLEKDAFLSRLKRICQRLTPPGGILIYQDLMLRMFDAVEREARQATDAAVMNAMNHNSGK